MNQVKNAQSLHNTYRNIGSNTVMVLERFEKLEARRTEICT